jgi:hypothetical protein
LAAAPARAQSGANTGLQGRIEDASGSSLPGVTVTLLRADTGERRVVTSSEDGAWEARFLTPGQYQITFERPSFKKLVREGVKVSTSEVATLNVTLEVGDVTQSVEVSAHGILLVGHGRAHARTQGT